MTLDRDTTQEAIKAMDALLSKYCVMDWSAPVRVPDYSGFKLAIFENREFPYKPVYLPFAMIACELHCDSLTSKDQERGSASDEGFSAFMKRKLLFSLEEMLTKEAQAVLAELRNPENMHISENTHRDSSLEHSADDIPKALTILNDRLRKYSSQGEEGDIDGFLQDAASWTEEAYGSHFALGTAIALTEMQCELLIQQEGQEAELAQLRLGMLKRLRATLSPEINEYIDAGKQRLPTSIAAEMPWR